MKPFPILLLALCDPVKALSLTGLVPRLKREIPNARITLVTTQASAQLFQDDILVDEIMAMDGAIFNLKTLKALSGLSRETWGLCVDIGPTLASRMMRAKTRFTLNAHDRSSPLKQICRALKIDEREVRPNLSVSAAREVQAKAMVGAVNGRAPLLVMAPGASWLGRRWPTERFAVLATRLMRDDGPLPRARLLIAGDESDRDTAVALSMATPRAQVLELTGKLDLLTAFAAFRYAAAFVGNDEIWLHLAAAAGIPAFGLFGPSDDAEAPPSDNAYIIRGPRRFEDILSLDPRRKQAACHMLDLSIDRVYDRIAQTVKADAVENDFIEELVYAQKL